MSVASRGALAAINHLLTSASWARERLAAHAGRHARVRSEPFELVFVICTDGFVSAPASADALSDVTLTVPLRALAELPAGGTERLASAVRIDGNAEFADALGFVFRHLRWDAEEDLSRVVGDIPAHRVMRGARALRDGTSRTLDALSGNLAEYLTGEQPLLVSRAALDMHHEELARLRDDLARLEKHTDRLSARILAGRGNATVARRQR